jgi:hypothetical protein
MSAFQVKGVIVRGFQDLPVDQVCHCSAIRYSHIATWDADLPIVQNAESMSTDSELEELVLSSQQGMFLISTTPLKIHSCMLEYTTFIFAWHACRYLSSGVKVL